MQEKYVEPNGHINEGHLDLQALGVTDEWIWGNGAETAVFAQAFGQGSTFVFRFSLQHDANRNVKASLPGRIVNCYYDREVRSSSQTFDTRSEMLDAIWTLVASVWAKVRSEPFAKDPDAVVDIYRMRAYSIAHEEQLFDEYLDLIRPWNQLMKKVATEVIPLQRLRRLGRIPGRRNDTLVSRRDVDESTRLVFTGLDFQDYLATYFEDDGQRFQCEVAGLARAAQVAVDFDNHLGLQRAPMTLVTVCKPGSIIPMVCGALYPYYPRGSVDDCIRRMNDRNVRIPAGLKFSWCAQMATAASYLHGPAKKYHMNLCPSSFMVDSDQNLVLVNWEQDHAEPYTTAPEADGTCDVVETEMKGSGGDKVPMLQYTKYTGQQQSSTAMGWPGRGGWMSRNPFPTWHAFCPRACEMAEVFSLGRTMWMLLRQLSEVDMVDVHHPSNGLEDWQHCDDIPDSIKCMVEACLRKDPNDRPDMSILRQFWRHVSPNVGAYQP